MEKAAQPMFTLTLSRRAALRASKVPTTARAVLAPASMLKKARTFPHLAREHAAMKAGLLSDSGEVAQSYEIHGEKAIHHLIGVHGETVGEFKKAAAKMAEAIRALGVEDVGVYLPGALPEQVASMVLALREAQYQYTLTKPSSKARKLSAAEIIVDNLEAAQEAFSAALALADGIDLAKDLGDQPGNYATPAHLAYAAVKLAERSSKRVKVRVLDKLSIAREKMDSFLAVAQGSKSSPVFIELSYQGDGKAKPVVLIGKGITFDSGGISLKPGAAMDEMKFDMCGAASVLGVFESLYKMRPKINVIGLIPSCENMPSGKAIKPGDVVVSRSGQTIEILNTDAEGRLILCDALDYAKKFSPKAVVDIATLTGACVMALGALRSGLYANDEHLGSALFSAGEISGDRCWRMPLDEEYGEGLKSNFADMANIGGREAGSVVAAKFLQKFVDYPWAHLDVAGSAWRSGSAKGSTGRPVALLMAYLLSQS